MSAVSHSPIFFRKYPTCLHDFVILFQYFSHILEWSAINSLPVTYTHVTFTCAIKTLFASHVKLQLFYKMIYVGFTDTKLEWVVEFRFINHSTWLPRDITVYNNNNFCEFTLKFFKNFIFFLNKEYLSLKKRQKVKNKAWLFYRTLSSLKKLKKFLKTQE